MSKRLIFLIVLIFISVSLFAQIRANTNAWISSRTAELKSSTWFFASTRGTLQMADEVRVHEVRGNWADVSSVRNSSLRGWTATSNLSARQIIAAGAGASASEVALAGRGFSRDVEDAFRAQGDLNFDAVDRVEAFSVSPDQLYRFLVEGNLNTGE